MVHEAAIRHSRGCSILSALLSLCLHSAIGFAAGGSRCKAGRHACNAQAASDRHNAGHGRSAATVLVSQGRLRRPWAASEPTVLPLLSRCCSGCD
eukprot:135337-Amphidinium_carterae.1